LFGEADLSRVKFDIVKSCLIISATTLAGCNPGFQAIQVQGAQSTFASSTVPTPVPTATPAPLPVPAPTSTPVAVQPPQSILPSLPSWNLSAQNAGAVATGVTILQASPNRVAAPPGATFNIGMQFNANTSVGGDYTIFVHFVDKNGNVAFTRDVGAAPVSSLWVGPITNLAEVTIPNGTAPGTYYMMAGLYSGANRVQLNPGPGVTADNQVRYYVGAINVVANISAPSALLPRTLDLTDYHLAFDEEFMSLSISDSRVNDGSRWYTQTKDCCGIGTSGVSSARDPYSLLPGGGLDIRANAVNGNWSTGIISSVDSAGKGFSQQYGYFEMKAKFPAGDGSWPGFWLLNTANLSGGTSEEIDIVEAYTHWPDRLHNTLHVYNSPGRPNDSVPSESNVLVLDTTADYHTYGLLWTEQTMTFYFDGAVTQQVPTPSVMRQPFWVLVNLGMGNAGFPQNTPSQNDMLIQYVRVYSK
jgi:beta-glucanase (GH16 family)